MIIIDNSKSKFSPLPNKKWNILCDIYVHFCHIDEVFVFLLQDDNIRERALDDMMDGVLEVKKEDILKMVGRNIHFFVKALIMLYIYYLNNNNNTQ